MDSGLGIYHTTAMATPHLWQTTTLIVLQGTHVHTREMVSEVHLHFLSQLFSSSFLSAFPSDTLVVT